MGPADSATLTLMVATPSAGVRSAAAEADRHGRLRHQQHARQRRQCRRRLRDGDDHDVGAGRPPPPTPPPAAPPVVIKPVRGVTLVAGRSTGSVKVRLKGTGRFVTLSSTCVPSLRLRDRHPQGDRQLTSAARRQGRSADRELPRQPVHRRPEAHLRPDRAHALGPRAQAVRQAARRSGHRARQRKLTPLARQEGQPQALRLRQGPFSTKGKYGAATVRGTKWSVSDACDRTIVSVTQGIVAMRDFVKRKTVLVRAGRSYTAVAPRR